MGVEVAGPDRGLEAGIRDRGGVRAAFTPKEICNSPQCLAAHTWHAVLVDAPFADLNRSSVEWIYAGVVNPAVYC